MIRKIMIYTALLLSACLLTGCTDRTDTYPATGAPLTVEAEVQISGSRAAMQVYDKRSFTEGDEIVVSASGGASYTYKKNASAKWIPATSAYHTVSGETYQGSYPQEFDGILPDQTTAEAFRLSNRLQTPSVSPVDNVVSFTGNNAFAPQAAKITVIVTYSAERTPMSATLTSQTPLCKDNGTSVQCLYTSGEITTATATHNWECIIAPASHQLGFSIVSQTGGVLKTGTYTATSALPFAAGYNYVYNFSSSGELILNSVTVTPFTDMPEQGAGSAT